MILAVVVSAIVGLSLMGCSGEGREPSARTPEPETTTTTRPLETRAGEVTALVDLINSLPVEAADGRTTPTAPPGGFDCIELADRFADVATEPSKLLVIAADTESPEDQELISAAQINVADGIASCHAGDPDRAAMFFASAAAAVDLLEDR